MADILVLGATGFTGQLVARHLSSHREHQHFTFALGARSEHKLRKLSSLLSSEQSKQDVPFYCIDVEDEAGLSLLIPQFRAVINLTTPYWKTGTAVVSACAGAGVHYLDLSGEMPWVMDIISRFDKDGPPKCSVIMPSCGFESIPSDLVAFCSASKLRETYGPSVEIGASVTAHDLVAFVSGGTLTSGISLLEDVPRDKFWSSLEPHALSPVKGLHMPYRWIYSLHSFPKPIIGSFFLLGSVNRAMVQRTWGLFQACDRPTNAMRRLDYGMAFEYDEFLAAPNRLVAGIITFVSLAVFAALVYFPPLRWLLKTRTASNPSYAELRKGSLQSTNVTTASMPGSERIQRRAQTVMKTRGGDVGYMGSAVMVGECALALILTPREQLMIDFHQSRVLTAVSALGDVLVNRLRETEFFEISSEVIPTE